MLFLEGSFDTMRQLDLLFVIKHVLIAMVNETIAVVDVGLIILNIIGTKEIVFHGPSEIDQTFLSFDMISNPLVGHDWIV